MCKARQDNAEDFGNYFANTLGCCPLHHFPELLLYSATHKTSVPVIRMASADCPRPPGGSDFQFPLKLGQEKSFRLIDA